MADINVAILGLSGTVVCLGLAYWVVRRGRAAERTRASSLQPQEQQQANVQVPGAAADPGTEFIPHEEILAAAQWRGQQTSGTEALSREEIFAAAQPRTQPTSGTEHMSRDEILAAAQARAQPVSGTETLAAAQPRAQPASGTEFMSREEILDAAQAREQQVSATTVLSRDASPAAPPLPERRLTATEMLARSSPVARPTPPTFEPKHVPIPPPAAVPSGPPDIPTDTLELHFRGALDGMTQLLEALAATHLSMRDLAGGPERLWRGNVEVLSLTSARVVEQLVLPTLRNPTTPAPRRLATALTLLELKRIDVPTLTLDLFAGLDAAGRTVLLDALAHWDDPRADKTILKGLERFATTHRREWLSLCAERSCELPAEVLGPLLEQKDPKLLGDGLRLIPFCASPDTYSAIIDRHLVAGPAELREPALLTGLLLARPTARVVSKQAARDPAMPLVCEALAAIGTDADTKALVTWAGKPSAPAHAGWALGVNGRLEALDACVSRLGHGDAVVVEAALAGFRHGSGFDGSAEHASRWWTEYRGQFKDGVRYLAGRPIGLEVVRERLLAASTRGRQALALELVLRSRGRSRVPRRRFPGAYMEAVARLSEAELGVRF